MPARKSTAPKPEKNKSLESWIWDAACSIRGAKDAPKYQDFILPLIFTKRLCDVFDDELNRIAAEVGSRKKAFQLAKRDHKLVRFFLPLEPADPEQPVWSVIRKLSEGGGQSAGEFYTPPEVGTIMALVLEPAPGMEVYDPTCGSGGLIIKCQNAAKEWGHSCPHKSKKGGDKSVATPLKLYGQDQWAWGAHLRRAQRARRVRQRRKLPNQYVADTWAMACMNMIIHDMEGTIEIGDTFKNPSIVDHAELKKNDYNISPSRYIHTRDAETYRPIAEIVAELDVIEAEAKETDKALRKILKQLGA